VQFGENKRVANQDRLDRMDTGTCTRSDGQALDAATLADGRQRTAQRVAACAAHLAARHTYS
jgi:hypothetical protein